MHSGLQLITHEYSLLAYRMDNPTLGAPIVYAHSSTAPSAFTAARGRGRRAVTASHATCKLLIVRKICRSAVAHCPGSSHSAVADYNQRPAGSGVVLMWDECVWDEWDQSPLLKLDADTRGRAGVKLETSKSRRMNFDRWSTTIIEGDSSEDDNFGRSHSASARRLPAQYGWL